jgi:hypothetical protein
MSTSLLFLGLLFGSVGFGYFLYGKRQAAIVPMVCGIALMVFPYFVSNVLILAVIGIALAALPYFYRV